MPKRYISFRRRNDGSQQVLGKGGTFLGDLCLPGQGEIFKRRAVFSVDGYEMEFTSECLRQIADELDAMAGSVRATDSKQQQ